MMKIAIWISSPTDALMIKVPNRQKIRQHFHYSILWYLRGGLLHSRVPSINGGTRCINVLEDPKNYLPTPLLFKKKSTPASYAPIPVYLEIKSKKQ